MLDFHSHFETSNSVLNTGLLLPDSYTVENEEAVFSSSNWHVGEIGLDKRFIDQMPMQKQIEVFEHLILRAKKENKSVSIHCVRCTEKAIEIIKKVNYPKNKILWHSFSGSSETAAILYKMGVIVSLSPFSKCDIESVCKNNPLYVLETDYEGQNTEEYFELVKSHYERMAGVLKISISELEEHCESIYTLFKN